MTSLHSNNDGGHAGGGTAGAPTDIVDVVDTGAIVEADAGASGECDVSTGATVVADVDAPCGSTEAPDCSICCEPFTLRLRKRTACPYCHQSACVACVKRYLLSSHDDPHCMACRRPWAPDFVDANLTHSFRNGPLKAHREDVLFDRERSMLPATQPEVERILEERRLRKELAELTQQRADLLNDMWRIQRRLRGLWLRRQNGGEEGEDDAAASERRRFIKPCPAPGCRGFLSAAYKCGMCEARVCPQCHELKAGSEASQQHVCLPEDVESVRAIARDSRPCPKCGCMIFRVSGCSQMFCTAPGCNTPFDWHTGRIVTGILHNPHYYEFLRQQQAQRDGAAGGGVIGRELGDIPCGGMPTAVGMARALQQANIERGEARELLAAHRLAVHVTDYELRHNYPAIDPAADAQTNRDLRVRYLMRELDDAQLKTMLQQREKARLKRQAINQVLTMLSNVSADFFRQLRIACTEGTGAAHAKDTLRQARALREYLNTSLATVSRRFSCVVPQVTAEWQFLTHKCS